MQSISKNIKDTAQMARIFIDEILKNKNRNEKAVVVGLSGDLGAGKTAFVQAVAKHLGIKGKVNSPTFVIMKKYRLSKQAVDKNFLANKTKPVSAGENFYQQPACRYLFHLDAYRLKNEKELFHLGWEEIIGNKEHLVFIEWPENIQKAMPKKHHKISISHTKEGHRKFKIKTS